MTDILIIGGGVIGMLTARELLQAGCTVTVLDRQQPGRESSWAGGGIVSPLYPWRYPAAVTRLASWSQQAYPALVEEIEQETGLEAELLQSGLLILDHDEIHAAQEWAKDYRQNLQLVDKKEVLELEANLSPQRMEAEEAIWMPEVRQVRNPRLVAALKQYLLQKGVNFIENQEVSEFIIEDGQVRGVLSGNQAFRADKVLLAAGAWSAGLAEKLGLSLSVQPVKGQMLLFRTPVGTVQHIVLSRDRYVIPRQDGRVLVGSTLEFEGFDKHTTEAAHQELYREASGIIPALAQYDIEHHWAGLRPGSEDSIPYIYADPDLPGLYINTGHFRNGIVLGPASARLMADLMLDRPTSLDPGDYGLQRDGLI